MQPLLLQHVHQFHVHQFFFLSTIPLSTNSFFCPPFLLPGHFLDHTPFLWPVLFLTTCFSGHTPFLWPVLFFWTRKGHGTEKEQGNAGQGNALCPDFFCHTLSLKKKKMQARRKGVWSEKELARGEWVPWSKKKRQREVVTPLLCPHLFYDHILFLATSFLDHIFYTFS